MEYKSDISGREQGLVVDVGSLYAWLCQLEDRRHARGVRYRLVTVLVFVILAKLAGEDRLSGISEWVRLRQQALADALQLGGVQAPHRTTYSRILGHVVDPEQFEQLMRDYFSKVASSGHSVQVSIDGKSLRGSIGCGQTQGVHRSCQNKAGC